MEGPFDDIDDFFLEEQKLEKQTAAAMSTSTSTATTPASTTTRKPPGAPRKPRTTASTNPGGVSTPRPLGQLRKKLTPPNGAATQIQKIDLAEPFPITLSFKHNQTPLNQIIDGTKEMGYYQLVTDTGAPALFLLSDVNHYGLKHNDAFDSYRFPVCGLTIQQRHGINGLQNIFDGRVDYEKTFGCSKSELFGVIETPSTILFNGFMSIKVDDKVKVYKAEREAKNWFETAIKRNFKDTRGCYDVLFGGGLSIRRSKTADENGEFRFFAGFALKALALSVKGPVIEKPGMSFGGGFPEIEACPF